MSLLQRFFLGDESMPVTVWSGVHFVVGIIAWLVGLQLWTWIALHVTWEIIENSTYGIAFFSHVGECAAKMARFKLWGTYGGDSIANTYIDTAFAVVGWAVADWMWGKK